MPLAFPPTKHLNYLRRGTLKASTASGFVLNMALWSLRRMKLVTNGSRRGVRGYLTTCVSALLSLSLSLALPLAPVPALATTYQLSGPDELVVGEDQTVTTVYEDTLYDLANKFSLGSEELIRVNPGVDPWLPGVGKKIIVPGRHILPPAPHEGIVVNLPEHRLYYYPKPKRGGPIEVIT